MRQEWNSWPLTGRSFLPTLGNSVSFSVKCNLYAHFERLQSSSLLGQGVGSRAGAFSCPISCHTSTWQFYKKIFTHMISFYPHHSPVNYVLFFPFYWLGEVKKFDQGHPKLVSKKSTNSNSDTSATSISPDPRKHHLRRHLIIKRMLVFLTVISLFTVIYLGCHLGLLVCFLWGRAVFIFCYEFTC